MLTFDDLANMLGCESHESRERLQKALVRASPAVPGSESNQRLAWLGDVVVNLVVSRRLFLCDTSTKRGDLTEARKTYVNRGELAKAALRLGLHDVLNPPMSKERAHDSPKILETAFEAVVGAQSLAVKLSAVETFLEGSLKLPPVH